MLKNFSALAASVITISLAISCDSRADPPAAVQGANQNMVTQFKGTLKSFQRGIVVVTRDDGTEVMVEPPDDISTFQFVATAKPPFLQRGALVRFSGTFNQAGVPMAPVTSVEVFQPIAGQVAGHTREQYIPGVYSDRNERNAQPQAIAKYDVVGALMGLDGSGMMMVQAGKQPVRVQLSADAKFEIRFNNLSLAQEGDPVSVAGFYQPPDETKVKAERVTITTDRVYGDPSTEAPKRTSRRRTRRPETTEPGETEVAKPAEKAAKGEGESEPKEGEKGGDE